MVYQIKTNQVQPIQPVPQPVVQSKSDYEIELEGAVNELAQGKEELEKEIEELKGVNYVNSLSDEKTFRLRLINSLTMIANNLSELDKTIREK